MDAHAFRPPPPDVVTSGQMTINSAAGDTKRPSVESGEYNVLLKYFVTFHRAWVARKMCVGYNYDLQKQSAHQNFPNLFDGATVTEQVSFAYCSVLYAQTVLNRPSMKVTTSLGGDWSSAYCYVC